MKKYNDFKLAKDLLTKQSSYFSNSTFSGVSPDYQISFILI